MYYFYFMKRISEEEYFSIVEAKKFFTVHCTTVRNWKHKRRKIDGNKNPIDFTLEDKKAIEKAAKKLGVQLGSLKM